MPHTDAMPAAICISDDGRASAVMENILSDTLLVVPAVSAEGWTWLAGRPAPNPSTATTATRRSCSMCPQSCLTQRGTPSRYCNRTRGEHTFHDSVPALRQVCLWVSWCHFFACSSPHPNKLHLHEKVMSMNHSESNSLLSALPSSVPPCQWFIAAYWLYCSIFCSHMHHIAHSCFFLTCTQ